MNKIRTKSGLLRKQNLLFCTNSELKIRDAMLEVELLGCDTALTDAVMLLQSALDKVSDYIDSQMTMEDK